MLYLCSEYFVQLLLPRRLLFGGCSGFRNPSGPGSLTSARVLGQGHLLFDCLPVCFTGLIFTSSPDGKRCPLTNEMLDHDGSANDSFRHIINSKEQSE